MTIKYQAPVYIFRPYYGLGRWSRRAYILMLLKHYKICISGNCLEKLNNDKGKKTKIIFLATVLKSKQTLKQLKHMHLVIIYSHSCRIL